MRSIRRFFGLKQVVLLGAVGAMLVFGVMWALASPDNPNHGISIAKNCKSPVRIGDAYQCGFTVDNTNNGINEAHDTWTITSIVDTVNSSPADPSGNIIDS